MKLFIRCWIITVFLLGPGMVYASGCRAVVVRKNVVVVEKAVAVAAVVTPVVAQFVAVPLYSAVYTPAPVYSPPAYTQPVSPVQGQPCPDHSAALKQVANLLLQLDSRLQKLEGGTVPPIVPPMTPADPPKGEKPLDPFNPGGAAQTAPEGRLLTLASRHCSACHDASRSAASGGKFTLLQGGKFSASLAPESLGKIIDELASKRMPKGGSMSEAERLEMISLMVSGK